MSTVTYVRHQHKIEWSLVHELLLEVSGGEPYTGWWAARVLGCDSRSVLRFKHEGCPDVYVEDLVERANRGVRYTPDNPPRPGEISKGKTRREYQVMERVPFDVVRPFIVERLGEDFTVTEGRRLFCVTRHTYADWRRTTGKGHYGVPVYQARAVLGLTRAQLGLDDE